MCGLVFSFANGAQAEPIQEQDASLQSVLLNAAQMSGLNNQQWLLELYSGRDYQPIWVYQSRLLPQARDVLGFLTELDIHGIVKPLAHAEALTQLRPDAELLAPLQVELQLSDTLFSYVGLFARDNTQVQTKRLSLISYLYSLGGADRPSEMLYQLLPQARGYWHLVDAYRELLQTPSSGLMLPKMHGEKLLRPGQQDAEVRLLRQRLIAKRYLDAALASDSTQYETQTAQALKRFQADNGLKPDGLLGQASRAALNREPEDVLRTVRANLARWQRENPSYPDNHIRVNIAAQELNYVYANDLVLSMKVIVGKPEHQTPQLQSRLRELVFQPYWNVPHSIAVNEYLPMLQRDADALNRLGLTLLSSWGPNGKTLNPREIDWSKISAEQFPYFIQQAPGPRNALGDIKFLFPNAHAVYLHDTPSRHLFTKDHRVFSHGCIRLEQPMALAQVLLGNHRESPSEVPPLDVANDHRLYLDEPVPVFLEYWTAWVDAQGKLQIREDLYQKDDELLDAPALMAVDQMQPVL